MHLAVALIRDSLKRQIADENLRSFELIIRILYYMLFTVKFLDDLEISLANIALNVQ